MFDAMQIANAVLKHTRAEDGLTVEAVYAAFDDLHDELQGAAEVSDANTQTRDIRAQFNWRRLVVIGRRLAFLARLRAPLTAYLILINGLYTTRSNSTWETE